MGSSRLGNLRGGKCIVGGKANLDKLLLGNGGREPAANGGGGGRICMPPACSGSHVPNRQVAEIIATPSIRSQKDQDEVIGAAKREHGERVGYWTEPESCVFRPQVAIRQQACK